MSPDDPIRVLFLCTGNSARSVLGEYLLRSMGSRFKTASAGAAPTGEVHPMALRVLRDVYGLDARGAASESWEVYADTPFDVVITVCDHARDTCPLVPDSPAIQAHWGSPDPAKAEGDEAEVEAVFRRVAEEIRRRVERFSRLPFAELDRSDLAARIRRIGTG